MCYVLIKGLPENIPLLGWEKREVLAKGGQRSVLQGE